METFTNERLIMASVIKEKIQEICKKYAGFEFDFANDDWKEMVDELEDLVLKEEFSCTQGMNQCVNGTGDCDSQSVVNGYCKYYSNKKFYEEPK
jgi:hypothetical protein